jgi:hypothetical protein
VDTVVFVAVRSVADTAVGLAGNSPAVVFVAVAAPSVAGLAEGMVAAVLPPLLRKILKKNSPI